jgi:hypothetical protein
VRLRITAAVVVLAGLALAGAGLVVYAIELQEIGEEVDQQIAQELDELELLAENNETSNPQDLLDTFLATNVPSTSELMLGWWNGEPQQVGAGSTHRELADLPDPVLVEAAPPRSTPTSERHPSSSSRSSPTANPPAASPSSSFTSRTPSALNCPT